MDANGWQAVLEGLPYILQGTWVTLAVVAGALALGLTLGLFLAVGQVYGSRPVRNVVGVYVWFFRGIPLLVLLFLFYFGILAALRVELSPFTISIGVLGLISSAYQSQILRGAILSLPEGQLKAARAIGMRDSQAIVFIITAPGPAPGHSGLDQRIHDHFKGFGRHLRFRGVRTHGPHPPCRRANLPALLALHSGGDHLHGAYLPRDQSPAPAGEEGGHGGLHPLNRDRWA